MRTLVVVIVVVLIVVVGVQVSRWLSAQQAPTTKVITLAWDCTDGSGQSCAALATQFRVYRQLSCTGSFTLVSTVNVPTTTAQVTSSLLTNTCWRVTAVSATGLESSVSNTIRFPIQFPGGFAVQLRWTAPVGGVAPAQYRVYKQTGCSGSVVLFATVQAPTTTYTITPPVSAADCWMISAMASDDSESAQTSPFQVPSTILGGTVPFPPRGPQ